MKQTRCDSDKAKTVQKYDSVGSVLLNEKIFLKNHTIIFWKIDVEGVVI